MQRTAPDLDSVGPLEASFVTPRNTVFQDGQRTVIHYFGQAVSLLDRRRSSLTIQSENAQLAHEAAYQFILSRAASISTGAA